jgi:hypothetical protein
LPTASVTCASIVLLVKTARTSLSTARGRPATRTSARRQGRTGRGSAWSAATALTAFCALRALGHVTKNTYSRSNSSLVLTQLAIKNSEIFHLPFLTLIMTAPKYTILPPRQLDVTHDDSGRLIHMIPIGWHVPTAPPSSAGTGVSVMVDVCVQVEYPADTAGDGRVQPHIPTTFTWSLPGAPTRSIDQTRHAEHDDAQPSPRLGTNEN